MAFENGLEYFNMNNDGCRAVVRLLHSSVSKIERKTVHTITTSDGKKKTVGCVASENNECPLCKSGNNPYERVYIHLIDYADGKEKVWARTPTILKQFEELEKSWGNLSNLVFQITRKGDNFPKYEIMMVPAQNYPAPDATKIDNEIAFRFFSHQNANELNEYLRTGVLPKHEKKQYIPKEEYYAKKNANQQNVPQTSNGYAIPQNVAPQNAYVPNMNGNSFNGYQQNVPMNTVPQNTVPQYAQQNVPNMAQNYAPQMQTQYQNYAPQNYQKPADNAQQFNTPAFVDDSSLPF